MVFSGGHLYSFSFSKTCPVLQKFFIGCYLFMWGLFTFFMWFGTFGKNRGIQFVFLSLTILFFSLAIRDWTGSSQIGALAGFEGIICGLSAIYLAMAEVSMKYTAGLSFP
jgi:succinate-acetate transporter protein